MRKWTSVLALAIAGALVATMAFAQSGGGGNPTAPKMPGAKQPDAGAPSASPATDADKTAPSASGSASGATSGTSTSDTGKSGGMKSDTMKSDMSKDRGMRAGRGGDRGQMKAIQQALKDKGHDPGAVDGVMGPKTRSALHDFQKKEGIKDTGRPDRETMSKLGVEPKTSGISEPSPGTSASPAMPSPGASDSSGSASGSTSGSPASPPRPGGAEKKY